MKMHDQEMGAVKWYCLVLDDLFISTPSAALFRTYIYSSVPWSCLFFIFMLIWLLWMIVSAHLPLLWLKTER